MSLSEGARCVYEIDDPERNLIVSIRVGKWCRLPYPGHKHGCPNYGKKPGCPPDAIPIHRYFSENHRLYLVYAEFNLENHARRMKHEHPWWSDRQCRCVLHWQQTARTTLRQNVINAMRLLGCDAVTYCPEGMGVNVFATARRVGLRLDKTRRIKIDRHVALIGTAWKGGKTTQRCTS